MDNEIILEPEQQDILFDIVFHHMVSRGIFMCGTICPDPDVFSHTHHRARRFIEMCMNLSLKHQLVIRRSGILLLLPIELHGPFLPRLRGCLIG